MTMLLQEAVAWLQSVDSGNIGMMFARFLDRQGHRCIREVSRYHVNSCRTQ